MRVEVRLFANLRERIPSARRGRASLDLEAGSSLQDLLEQLEIHPMQAQMVLVNGVQMLRDVAARRAHSLAEGDIIAIFPPLAGG